MKKISKVVTASALLFTLVNPLEVFAEGNVTNISTTSENKVTQDVVVNATEVNGEVVFEVTAVKDTYDTVLHATVDGKKFTYNLGNLKKGQVSKVVQAAEGKEATISKENKGPKALPNTSTVRQLVEKEVNYNNNVNGKVIEAKVVYKTYELVEVNDGTSTAPVAKPGESNKPTPPVAAPGDGNNTPKPPVAPPGEGNKPTPPVATPGDGNKPTPPGDGNNTPKPPVAEPGDGNKPKPPVATPGDGNTTPKPPVAAPGEGNKPKPPVATPGDGNTTPKPPVAAPGDGNTTPKPPVAEPGDGNKPTTPPGVKPQPQPTPPGDGNKPTTPPEVTPQPQPTPPVATPGDGNTTPKPPVAEPGDGNKPTTPPEVTPQPQPTPPGDGSNQPKPTPSGVTKINSEVTKADPGNVIVGLKGEFDTPNKDAILAEINRIRKEAVEQGLADRYVPIKWSTELEKTALVRAAEASVTVGQHARLTNKNIWTAYPDRVGSENLAWNNSGINKAIQQWYGEKADFIKKKNGEAVSGQTGHYKSLIDPQFTHMGIAAFRNSKAPYGGVTAAQALASSGNSESLVGTYGKAVLYTEATESKLPEYKQKADLEQN